MPLLLDLYQSEYLDLLTPFEDRLRSSPNLLLVLSLIDEVNKFWLRRLDVVEKDIEFLTKTGTCMILSGAVYLDYKENEHYPYKFLGKKHFLHDSLLKLEFTFRIPEEHMNFEKTLRYFRKAFEDELLVLRNAREHFYYIPLQMLVERRISQRDELLNRGFWDVVSSLVGHNVGNDVDFHAQFPSYEAIEGALGAERAREIVLLNEGDRDLSIRDRVEGYFDSQLDLKRVMAEKSEPQKFLAALAAYTMQVLDILITGICFRLVPYIRFNITFYYFLMIMPAFTADATVKKMIQSTMVTFMAHKQTAIDVIVNMEFSEFSRRLSDSDNLAEILQELEKKNIDITVQGLPEVREVIRRVLAEFVGEMPGNPATRARTNHGAEPNGVLRVLVAKSTKGKQ